MDRSLPLGCVAALIVSAHGGCPSGTVTDGDPDPPDYPEVGQVDPGACLEDDPVPACADDQIDGAACVVTIHNATGRSLTSLSLKRLCEHGGTDVDGYPTSPVYPVLGGDEELASGDSIEQEVVAAPYTLRAGHMPEDPPDLYSYGGLEFTCEDGEALELTVDDGILFDGALIVLDDTEVPLAEIRLAGIGDPVWGDNLLEAPLQPGEMRTLDPADGPGYVMTVDRDGRWTWDSFHLASSRGACHFPGSQELPGEPCHWTLVNGTGDAGPWRTAVAESTGCEQDLYSTLEYFDAFSPVGDELTILAPVGDWQLVVHGKFTSWVVRDLSCAAGGSQSIPVGPEHEVPGLWDDC